MWNSSGGKQHKAACQAAHYPPQPKLRGSCQNHDGLISSNISRAKLEVYKNGCKHR
jgi:hypothetical protein